MSKKPRNLFYANRMQRHKQIREREEAEEYKQQQLRKQKKRRGKRPVYERQKGYWPYPRGLFHYVQKRTRVSRSAFVLLLSIMSRLPHCRCGRKWLMQDAGMRSSQTFYKHITVLEDAGLITSLPRQGLTTVYEVGDELRSILKELYEMEKEPWILQN